ncbi:MarR family winged helix-turn-helix transcriptional regulator [Herbiconiux sp. L3-i23]|uniref:MarR family winged helix-turn-helix transcriptional regulator n=1 Tax=Herbiconiux sp. L3-i23 TaxID=2905871 RepID=UPI002069066B|nr:MarR family transcriptional regulator [Herbiconiux sp. L3-i23]BDI22859.1 hypothetical protein L3i23_16350 [Herbiconiux sp. L3-i23]
MSTSDETQSTAPAGGFDPDSPYNAALVASAEFVRAVDALRRRFAAGLGVGMTEMQAMSYVLEAGGVLTPKALAAHLDLSTGAVTALLDRLEANGAIERRANPSDRRSTLIALTDTGKRSIEGNYVEYEELVVAAAKSKSAKDLKVIAEFFHELAQSFDKAV